MEFVTNERLWQAGVMSLIVFNVIMDDIIKASLPKPNVQIDGI